MVKCSRLKFCRMGNAPVIKRQKGIQFTLFPGANYGRHHGPFLFFCHKKHLPFAQGFESMSQLPLDQFHEHVVGVATAHPELGHGVVS